MFWERPWPPLPDIAAGVGGQVPLMPGNEGIDAEGVIPAGRGVCLVLRIVGISTLSSTCMLETSFSSWREACVRAVTREEAREKRADGSLAMQCMMTSARAGGKFGLINAGEAGI